jgi:hypothetical protein
MERKIENASKTRNFEVAPRSCHAVRYEVGER